MHSHKSFHSMSSKLDLATSAGIEPATQRDRLADVTIFSQSSRLDIRSHSPLGDSHCHQPGGL